MSTTELRIPEPRVPIAIRTATLDDVPFIDQLQKMHTHMVGWFPKKQMESYIELGHVLVAEGVHHGEHGEHEGEHGFGSYSDASSHASPSVSSASSVVNRAEGVHHGEHGEHGGEHGFGSDSDASSHSSPSVSSVSSVVNRPLGYIIYKDRYMKRDDVGIIYQLNVVPMEQRQLIGATLVKAAFERAAYGCKLFCCWCAQDIQANWFWESIGFVPLAFRTGSRGKQRIHIFWQRRIREGDEQTPWWFPYQTQAGAVREDRIVLPIPPETHWRDAKPLVLPGVEHPHPGLPPRGEGEGDRKLLPGGSPLRARPEQPVLSRAERALIMRSQSNHLKGVPMGKKAVVTGSGIKYVDRTDFVPELDDPELVREQAEKAEKKRARASERAKRPRAKHDAKLLEKARELRDRYLEDVNERGLLPAAWMDGKYEVGRSQLLEDQRARVDGSGVDGNAVEGTKPQRLLDAA